MSRRQTRLQDFYPQRRQNIGSQSAPSASTQKQPWAVLDDGSLNDATLGRQETNTRQRRHMDVQSFKRPTSASGTEEQHKDCSRRGTESRYRRYGEQYVVLPWSKHNTLCGRNGQTCLVFDLQVHMLTENTVATTTQLVQLMQSLMVPLIGESVAFGSSFHALAMTMDQLLSPAERESFFREVLPWMMRLLPEAIHYFGEEPLPVLAQGKNNRVLLNKPQTVILMTCAFFSLFPGRSMMQDNTRSALGISRRLPVCNFHSLFDVPSNKRCSAVHHKIRCLLEYFFIMFRQHSTGGWETDGSLVEINRVGYPTFPEFSSSEATLTPLTLVGDGLIEDDLGALHADFANKVIGGGVLRRGCVQEEIRFVVTPEALLSLLFCETMLDHEAVFISGVGQYSQYTGYGSTFQWSGGLEGSKGRLQCVELPASTCSSTMPTKLPPTMLNVSIVAMDAISFASGDRRPPAQYLASWITREANKAYVAFHGPSVEHACLQLCHTGPVATGNWGCGVFSGDVELKLLIQWCAAAVAQRPVRYYVFDRVELLNTFPPLLEKLQREHWSVGRLYSQLLFYNVYRTEECRGKTPMGLFQYLMASSEPSA